MPGIFHDLERVRQGMSYPDYLRYVGMEAEAARAAIEAGDSTEHERFLPLNLQRMSRIDRTHTLSRELVDVAARMAKPQLWMVLTEAWCADSAQALPYISHIAQGSDLIEIRFLLRDANPDVMDLFLTGGNRSIPKLVAFDEEGAELFRWGPRPAEATELFRREREAGLSKSGIHEKLHLWYGRDRGRTIEREFIDILTRLA